jgi:hypothetical protein
LSRKAWKNQLRTKICAHLKLLEDAGEIRPGRATEYRVLLGKILEYLTPDPDTA